VSSDWNCDRVRERLAHLREEPFWAGERSAILGHVSGCPRCAHLPGVESVLDEVGPAQTAATAPQNDRSAEEPGSPLTLLMVFASVVALFFAGHSLGRVVRTLRGPSSAAPLPSPSLGPGPTNPPGDTPPPDTAARERVEAMIGDVARTAEGYLARIANVDPSRAAAVSRLSGELLWALGQGGLLRKLRELRQNPAVTGSKELGQIEAVLIRAGAARGQPREWKALQKLIRSFGLIKACRRLQPAQGKGGAP